MFFQLFKLPLILRSCFRYHFHVFSNPPFIFEQLHRKKKGLNTRDDHEIARECKKNTSSEFIKKMKNIICRESFCGDFR
jgi:tRNA1(Val) A37 N6-methylase TrmN6